VVSDSDRKTLTGKREIYKLHEHCACILTARQDRCHVRIDTRTAAGWQVKLLAKPTDVLALADFGRHCRVSDLYKGTPLLPRSMRRTRR